MATAGTPTGLARPTPPEPLRTPGPLLRPKGPPPVPWRMDLGGSNGLVRVSGVWVVVPQSISMSLPFTPQDPSVLSLSLV